MLMDKDGHAQMLIASMETNVAKMRLEVQMYTHNAYSTLLNMLKHDNRIEVGDKYHAIGMVMTVSEIELCKEDPKGLSLVLTHPSGKKVAIGMSQVRRVDKA